MGAMVVDELVAAIDRVCEADPSALSDGETLEALFVQHSRLQAAIARAAAAFDRSAAWRADGSRSAAGWLATRTGLPRRDVAHTVRLGRELVDMPAVEKSWLAGRISQVHVSLLNRARTPVTEDSFGRDEAMLVDD